jgi:hypothetical protein
MSLVQAEPSQKVKATPNQLQHKKASIEESPQNAKGSSFKSA